MFHSCNKAFLRTIIENKELMYAGHTHFFNILLRYYLHPIPAGIYLFNVNNENTRTTSDICSEFTIKTPEQRQWRRLYVIRLFQIISKEKEMDFLNFFHALSEYQKIVM